MNNIETVKLDTSSGKYENALKQVEFAIASAAVRGVDIIKLSCENPICKTFRSNMMRSVRHFKKEGRINCFVAGENLKGDNDVTRYLLQKADYIKSDADFENENENIVVVYVKSSF